ncbi:MAG TPA: UDP-N-acetylmuramate dehydrogenase [Mycobacteriales bacterium]|nr:UDP-N-acetylmuramate dehydrogenase [Mycobacteriales bacterium]
MQVSRGAPVAPLTTLRLGGPAGRLVEAGSAAEIVDAVRAAGDDLLLLGGGSNLVLADAGWPGTVVLVRSRGVAVTDGVVIAEAGEPWDELVARTVAEGRSGLECLAGIPGLTGATPVQNVGAYGQEVADTIIRVDAYDRVADEVCTLGPEDCGFGYRDSLFKHTDRWVVLRVAFALARTGKSAPIRYAELARALGVELGQVAPLADVRSAVLDLRRAKGMVVDPADRDTWSVGSFFTNPVLDADRLAAFDARAAGPYPSWPTGAGTKLSAAWLIERSGFTKGYGGESVRVSGKHTLALTHRGGGSTAELVALAREIRDGVRDRFGVELRPEPRLVGVVL